MIDWLIQQGGSFHPLAHYVKVPSGFSVLAKETIPTESIIASCPFNLIITHESSLHFLESLFPKESLSILSARQCIASYLCFHSILNPSITPGLLHAPYVNTLPSQDKLRTGLYYTDVELEAFRGTNLFGAIADRKEQWQDEWRACRAIISAVDTTWGDQFTWELYCLCATHLSSRAFPSSLLSKNPTLQSSPSTSPILLPGVDALNHARGQPVSWVVSSSTISLLTHTPTPAGAEIYNNYGLKSNAELILGYGFTLPSNPDDTMMLKIPGQSRWEVGRDGKGMDDVWSGFMRAIALATEEDGYEAMLETADVLEDAFQDLLRRLPGRNKLEHIDIRPDVGSMLHDYVEGQREIIEAALCHVEDKRQEAINLAREQGVEIVLEESED